ncbi:MAG: IS3 family transposase [Phycisphaeraceae bacterium]
MGQPRSTQRYEAKERDDEPALLKRMSEWVRRHPRFGDRRIHAMLRRQGWKVGRHRVHRLWKREGYCVPVKTKKKSRLGVSANGVVRRRAESINDV